MGKRDFGFIWAHWGDLVGLTVLLLGIMMVMVAPLYLAAPDADKVFSVGNGLVIGAMGFLKLRTQQKVPNGNNGKAEEPLKELEK